MTIAKVIREVFVCMEWVVNSEIVFYVLSIIFLFFAIWLTLGTFWRLLRDHYIFKRGGSR